MNPLRLLLVGSLVAFLAPATPLLAQKPATYPDSEAGQHVGETATVTGKLVAITKSSKGHSYLNLGGRFPQQLFTGVVFSSDGGTVGDLTQYEGKEIALTGKIDLSPDQKPQIILRKPDQIALADGTAPTAATMPPAAPAAPAAAPAAPVLASAATPAPKPAAPAAKIALGPNWNSPGQGSEMIRKDLAKLFGGQSLPPEMDAGIFVYPDIPYLTPLAAAKKRLNLEGVAASTNRVTCPGMPVGSFTAHSFAGVFAGGYTRLFLVTDNAAQVVSVLAVDDNVRQRTPDVTDTGGYHAYNFLSLRVKGNPDLIVRHTVVPEGAPAGTVVVESLLIDPTDLDKPGTTKTSSTGKTYTPRTPKSGKVMERSRWYVPVPVVNLILRCVGSR